MRRIARVHMGIFCVLALGGSAAQAAPGSMPTVGGEPTFATKADGMISTVEGFISANDFVSAEKAAVELTTQSPQYLKGWMLLGYCQSYNKHFEESNQSYEQALTLGADANAVKMRIAYNYIRMGQYDDARLAYRSVLDMSPDDIEALSQLGYLEGKLGNYDQSAAYYRTILRKQPDNTTVIDALAKIEEKRGGNGVKDLLLQNLALEPENTETLGRLGLLYIKEKDFKSAIDPLSRLVALEPNNDKAWRNLGVAQYQIGDKREAAGSFEKVRQLGADMNELYGPLADCYLEAGATTDALTIIQEGVAAGAQEAWLYCMWGKVMEKRRAYDTAISKFAVAARTGEEPWSTYARKQMARQATLKKREEMLSSQGMQ